MVKLQLLALVLFACYAGSNAFWNPYASFFRGSASRRRPSGNSGDPLLLTKYLKAGQIQQARNLARVDHPILGAIESYTGFMTVDENYNSNIFFYYIVAKNNREQAPIQVWLQGGPGASSLFGLFEEHGPFIIHKNLSIAHREFSWHQNHHMIYIDNPVGAGFSFTDNDAGYAKNQDDVSKNLLEFIHQFFIMFPNLLKHPFYISGESYGGKFAASFGDIIHNTPIQPKINLHGLAIGDGYMDPINQLNYGEYLYELGLIDKNARAKFDQDTTAAIACIERTDMTCANHLIEGLFGGANVTESFFKQITGFESFFNYIKGDDDRESALIEFLNLPEIRKGIHVGDKQFCNSEGRSKVAEYLSNDLMDTVSIKVSELLSHYRIMFYTGQLDIICGYPMLIDFLLKLPFEGADEYKQANREIYRIDREIAGYKKKAGRLREVLIRNAGHMVPRDQPKWAFDLISSFTHQKNF